MKVKKKEEVDGIIEKARRLFVIKEMEKGVEGSRWFSKRAFKTFCKYTKKQKQTNKIFFSSCLNKLRVFNKFNFIV